MLNEWASGPDETFFDGCPPALEDLLLAESLSGMRALEPGQPEVGPRTLAGLASLYVAADPADLSNELEGYGIAASASAHWARGSLDDESLVIHLELFDDVAGAMGWTRPHDDSGDLIPGIDDARLTTAIHQGRDDVTDYRALPVQRVAFGRVCNVAITVFHRSRTEDVPDVDIVALFRRQADVVAENCAALTSAQPASGLPSLGDFPAGWETLEPGSADAHPYEEVVAQCATGSRSVLDVAGVGTAYARVNGDGTFGPAAYPITLLFSNDFEAAEAVRQLTTSNFTDCLDAAAADDPLDNVPFLRGDFKYLGAEIAERRDVCVCRRALDDASYVGVMFDVQPVTDGPQMSQLAYGFYILRAGPLVQVTRFAAFTPDDTQAVQDAVLSPF